MDKSQKPRRLGSVLCAPWYGAMGWWCWWCCCRGVGGGAFAMVMVVVVPPLPLWSPPWW